MSKSQKGLKVHFPRGEESISLYVKKSKSTKSAFSEGEKVYKSKSQKLVKMYFRRDIYLH